MEPFASPKFPKKESDDLSSKMKKMNINEDYLIEMMNCTHDTVRKSIKSHNNLFEKNLIKGIVSKKKIRFEYEGFDLDLTYITSNLVAMGFPASKSSIEKYFRNNMKDVQKFFNKRHPSKHKVYNLCTERCYPDNSFFKQAYYPFEDHEAPPINLILPFCKDVHDWLSENPENVAAIHCKAGKGRTGTMICCYMIYAQIVKNADDALRYYGQMRTVNGKGVTIPSQIRYVYYFEQIVKSRLPYPLPSPIVLVSKVKIHTIPHYGLMTWQCTPYFRIDNDNKSFNSKDCNKVTSFKMEPYIEMNVNKFQVSGDVKFTFYNKKPIGKDTMFSFWFNTFFIPSDGLVVIKKSMLDKAFKDKENKIFDSNLKVEVHCIFVDENLNAIDLKYFNED